ILSMKYFLIAIIAILAGLHANAQQYIIKGHIYDLQGHQALRNATIEAIETQVKTTTDETGYFEIRSDRRAENLRISMLGYRTQVIGSGDENKNLNIQLEPDAVSLNEVRITAYGVSRTNKETAG